MFGVMYGVMNRLVGAYALAVNTRPSKFRNDTAWPDQVPGAN